MHAQAAADSMVKFCVGVDRRPSLGTPDHPFQPITRLCAGCHDPVTARTGDYSMTSGRGVTCLGCHDVTRLVQGGGNGDLQATTHDWTKDHTAWRRQPRSIVAAGGPSSAAAVTWSVRGRGAYASLAGTLDEYEASLYSPSTRCVDCHMAEVGTTATTNHRFPGGNVYLEEVDRRRDVDHADERQNPHRLRGCQISAQQISGGELVTLRNGGAGHWFLHGGVADIREPWVELGSPGTCSRQRLSRTHRWPRRRDQPLRRRAPRAWGSTSPAPTGRSSTSTS